MMPEDEVNDSPIEEVRLTVPITDDPTLPCLTFRTWVLGIVSCAALAFLNQFFGYRQNAISVTSVSAQILVLPLGKLMAASLPRTAVKVPGTKWSFSMNPGPFNLKEHCLITIFANAGSSGVYAVSIVTIVKAFYHRQLDPAAAVLLIHSTQILGYGWAGIFRKYLVDSPYMWWPSNLVQVSLFRALHDVEIRRKGGLTRLQFFIIVLVSSFSYYIIPNYLFPSITALSFVCWIWKDSVTAQQIGSGLQGLGIGSFAFDWATVAGFLGSPLATPGFAIINVLVGFILIVYIVLPIAYWSNMYNAKRFPIISSHVFDANGTKYNLSLVLNDKTFDFNRAGYDSYSKVNLSVFFVLSYGTSFATLAATVSHVALFYGRNIWQQTRASFQDKFGDVHTRLMKKNYDSVPQWCLPVSWFWLLERHCMHAKDFTAAGLNVISEMIIGYMHPGKPLANVVFKTYGTTSMSQAITFLSDFKLGHYMKIPPKSMFLVQLVGTIVSSVVYLATAWWILSTIQNICDQSKLPPGSPWTCPEDNVFYDASIIWGVIGPLRMFGKLGLYPGLNYFFLFGLLAPVPVWYLSHKYPEKKWIRLINIPIIISGPSAMPVAKAVNYVCWFSGTVLQLVRVQEV
ncbi:Oligopeptide transporter 5 [Sesamum angolense]|uniref:Oligopeptide transporter 5 n=1 Tax=Sesamum angolense TaxID=2727404 RepID=A0AAE1WSI9_9LAMI|nr:Oligopeptide transporter 5 [Sesamum angolense]